MAVLKVRDENGVVHEIVSLKGEPGGGGGDGGPYDLSDITCTGYNNAYECVVLIQEQAELAAYQAGAAGEKADEALGYALDNKSKLSAVETITEELNDGFVRLENEVIPGISDKATEALAGAEIANTKVAELVAQMGDIETALDTIIAIQNELIGGDGE
jgi:hypothetical protein